MSHRLESADLTPTEEYAADLLVKGMAVAVVDPGWPTVHKYRLITTVNGILGDPDARRGTLGPATVVLRKIYATLPPLDPRPMPEIIDIGHPVFTTVDAEYDRAQFAMRVLQDQEYYALDALVDAGGVS